MSKKNNQFIGKEQAMSDNSEFDFDFDNDTVQLPEEVYLALIYAFISAEALLPDSRKQAVMQFLEIQTQNWSNEDTTCEVSVPREVNSVLLSAYALAEPYLPQEQQHVIKNWASENFS